MRDIYLKRVFHYFPVSKQRLKRDMLILISVAGTILLQSSRITFFKEFLPKFVERVYLLSKTKLVFAKVKSKWSLVGILLPDAL